MWQDPTVDEGGTMVLIFAVIAAGMFINGAFKKGQNYGVLSVVAVVGLFLALVSFPDFRAMAIVGFGIFFVVGLALSFLRDLL